MVAKQKTLIIGLGVTGLSCVRHLASRDDLTVIDTRLEPPELAEFEREFPDVPIHLGVSELEDTAGFDRVVVSPGVPLDSPLLAGLAPAVAMISDIDLFCEAADVPIVAVTGTNGKSTVTSLVGHLLEGAGVQAVVGGNLGDAALNLLSRRAQVYVLELSSFQLERMATQHFHAATVLNVSEDHMDRHGNMTAYAAAKQRIYRSCGLAVAHRGETATFPESNCPVTTFGDDMPEEGHWGIGIQDGQRWLVRGGTPILATAELSLAGVHNEQNVLAAMALASVFDVPLPVLARAARSFQGLAHRCQRVAEVRGVTYINDSKATNVGATEAALVGLGSTLPGSGAQIVLIAGGDGKGADFRALADVVGRFVKALVLLGRDAPALQAALGEQTETHRVADMDEAVAVSARIAAAGDLVLLSPACSSLDMYRNFAARGDDFARAVGALAA